MPHPLKAVRSHLSLLAGVLALCSPLSLTFAAEGEPRAPEVATPTPSTAPIPTDKAVASHAPFEVGDCRVCHARADRRDPGKAISPINDNCLSCHDEMTTAQRPSGDTHPGPAESCVGCHNPHNAARKFLLLPGVKAPQR